MILVLEALVRTARGSAWVTVAHLKEMREAKIAATGEVLSIVDWRYRLSGEEAQ